MSRLRVKIFWGKEIAHFNNGITTVVSEEAGCFVF